MTRKNFFLRISGLFSGILMKFTIIETLLIYTNRKKTGWWISIEGRGKMNNQDKWKINTQMHFILLKTRQRASIKEYGSMENLIFHYMIFHLGKVPRMGITYFRPRIPEDQLIRVTSERQVRGTSEPTDALFTDLFGRTWMEFGIGKYSLFRFYTPVHSARTKQLDQGVFRAKNKIIKFVSSWKFGSFRDGEKLSGLYVPLNFYFIM